MIGSIGRPNIVVAVLDCVRASDFASIELPRARMPFLSRLATEVTEFPRAVSPSSWTLPSHASLFTGLPPWEHGCHAKGRLGLAPSQPHLASRLSSAGYRTCSLSVNPAVSPSHGMVSGFDQAAWGGWWEPFLRYPTERPPHESGGPRGYLANPLSRVHESLLADLVMPLWKGIGHHPFLLSGFHHLASRLAREPASPSPIMGSWLEPTFDRWVRATPADTPVFAFVNLLDAHEPYFPEAPASADLRAWWDYVTTRQDSSAWLTGRWEPRPGDLERLHGIYVRMIEGLDRRLERLVKTLVDTGRWDNTALIITSDHGQAFGEHGTLFHMLRVDEANVRIPLWLRLPRGESATGRAREWVTLTDIAPTVLGLAGAPSASLPGEDLRLLAERDPTRTILTFSDGFMGTDLVDHPHPLASRRFDRVLVAAYQGESKVTYDASARTAAAFDVRHDPAERHDVWDPADAAMTRLESLARTAGERVLATPRGEPTPEVQARLGTWGYL